MPIRITKGDLLAERVDAIVNTVNTIGVMGKGIALQFKRKWPANAKAYEAACKRGEVVPGKMFVFDNGRLAEPKYIINFPTKRDWRRPSRLDDIDDGLKDLVDQVKTLGIRSIAIPPLGCGNGGLDWWQVRPRIEKAFSNVPDVDVHLFEPNEPEVVRELVPELQKPKMTAGRAAVLTVLSIYRQMLYPLSQLEVQKLVYFLWRTGQSFSGLEFKKHTYGPYAPALRHVLTKMDGAYLNGVGDGTSRSEITVIPSALDEANAFLASQNNTETASRVARISRLISGFETPYGMELLATVHWAALQGGAPASVDEVVGRVASWNERKRKLMKPDHLRAAYNRLKVEHWI